MKLWNDSTGLWDLLNLWICENLGALYPSNPWTLEPQEKTRYPLGPETGGLWKHQTLESLS